MMKRINNNRKNETEKKKMCPKFAEHVCCHFLAQIVKVVIVCMYSFVLQRPCEQ